MPALLAIATIAVAADSEYGLSVRAQPGARSKSEVILEVIVSTPSSRGTSLLPLRPGAAPTKLRANTNGEKGPNGSLAKTEMIASLDAYGDTVTYSVETVVDGRVVASRKGSIDVHVAQPRCARPQ